MKLQWVDAKKGIYTGLIKLKVEEGERTIDFADTPTFIRKSDWLY